MRGLYVFYGVMISAVFSLSGFQFALAQPTNAPNIHDLPGFIAIGDKDEAASDLVYEGRRLLPSEARELVRTGVVSDLSLLNPDPTTDLWSDEFPRSLDSGDFSLGLKSDGESVDFLSNFFSPISTFEFIVEKEIGGAKISRKVRVGPKMRNIMARKALLEKIGYQMTNVQYVRNFEVNFRGVSSRNSFIERMKSGNKVDPQRWLMNSVDDDSSKAIFREAVIIDANPQVYDFVRGDVIDRVIIGRRTFNALLVPFVLIDVPESVNVMRWHVGQIQNNQILLPYDGGKEFTTTWDDARWVVRRLARLTREDFDEVLSYSNYPDSVRALVLEKILSRRNHLLELFNLTNEFQKFEINDQLDYGDEVVDGKLVRLDWPEYSTRFANEDPESPIDGGELFSLLKSRVISNAISNLVKWVNDNQIPDTDIQRKVFEHQIDLAAKQFAEGIATGKVSEIPFGFWTVPYWNGNIIASRDVVAGNYLGAENTIQIADTIGYSAATGVFVGTDGLPAKLGVTGRGQIFRTVTYTHLKPITSIRASLEEPFHNIVVPLVMHDYYSSIEPIMDGSINQMTDEEKQKVVKETVAAFKNSLQVGESVIVNKIFGGSVAAGAGYSFTERLSAQATLNNQLQMFSRLHILRAKENEIHVYKDPARFNEFGFTLGLQAEIEILRIGFKNKKGQAKSHFFKVDLETDLEKNPGVIDDLSGLHRVLKDKKVDHLELTQDPWVVTHKFHEKSRDISFFAWRWLSLDSVDGIGVQTPDGQEIDFIRSRLGKRKGKNYEDLGYDVINALIEEYSESEIAVAAQSTNDPGDTFFGRSQSREVVLDWKLGNEAKDRLPEQYAQFAYKWRGWEIKKDKLQEVIDSLNDFYETDFFPDGTLAQTQKVQLYTLNLSVSIYQSGIDHLLSRDDRWIRATFHNFRRMSEWVEKGEFELEGHIDYIRNEWERREYIIDRFFRHRDRYIKDLEDGDIKNASKHLVRLVEIAERLVTFEGFRLLFGPQENFYIQASLQGFKIGDEDGDRMFASNSIGSIGADFAPGPLITTQIASGMTASEFFILWLLEQL